MRFDPAESSSSARCVVLKKQITSNYKLTRITFYTNMYLSDHLNCLENRSDQISKIALFIFNVKRA